MAQRLLTSRGVMTFTEATDLTIERLFRYKEYEEELSRKQNEKHDLEEE